MQRPTVYGLRLLVILSSDVFIIFAFSFFKPQTRAPGLDLTSREAGAARVVTTNSVWHASNAIDIAPVPAPPVSRLLAGRAVHFGSVAP